MQGRTGPAKFRVMPGICVTSVIIINKRKKRTDILDALIQKSAAVESPLPVKRFVLFSKNGFTESLLKRAAEDRRIVLIEGLERIDLEQKGI